MDALKLGLRENGLVEGKDYGLEPRWAEGRYERFPALAHELLDKGCSLHHRHYDRRSPRGAARHLGHPDSQAHAAGCVCAHPWCPPSGPVVGALPCAWAAEVSALSRLSPDTRRHPAVRCQPLRTRTAHVVPLRPIATAKDPSDSLEYRPRPHARTPHSFTPDDALLPQTLDHLKEAARRYCGMGWAGIGRPHRGAIEPTYPSASERSPIMSIRPVKWIVTSTPTLEGPSGDRRVRPVPAARRFPQRPSRPARKGIRSLLISGKPLEEPVAWKFKLLGSHY